MGNGASTGGYDAYSQRFNHFHNVQRDSASALASRGGISPSCQALLFSLSHSGLSSSWIMLYAV